MKKFIIAVIILISLSTQASTDNWYGYNCSVGQTGQSSYELTLYRNQNIPNSDIALAQLKAMNVCSGGRVKEWKDAFTIDLDGYTTTNTSLVNDKNMSSITMDFYCHFDSRK